MVRKVRYFGGGRELCVLGVRKVKYYGLCYFGVCEQSEYFVVGRKVRYFG